MKIRDMGNIRMSRTHQADQVGKLDGVEMVMTDERKKKRNRLKIVSVAVCVCAVSE